MSSKGLTEQLVLEPVAYYILAILIFGYPCPKRESHSRIENMVDRIMDLRRVDTKRTC